METETKQNKNKGSKSTKSTKKNAKSNTEVIEQSEVIEQPEVIEQSEIVEQHEVIENPEVEETEEVSTTNVVNNDKTIFLKYISNINEDYVNINKFNFKKIEFNSDESKTVKTILASIGIQREKFAVKIIENFWNDKKSKKTSKTQDGTEVKKDTSTHAVNKKKKAYEEVLNFMNLEKDTLVSRTDVMKAIYGYVDYERNTNPGEINIEGDKKSFKLVGKLFNLFKFLFETGKEKGAISNEIEFPSQLANTDIMKYTSLCFIPDKKV